MSFDLSTLIGFVVGALIVAVVYVQTVQSCLQKRCERDGN
jgi:hypothetical protein